MRKIFILIIISGIALAKLNIYTTVSPQVVMVKLIAKNKVNISSLVNDGKDPHTFTPKTQDMIAISKADIYLSIGLREIEQRWITKLKSQNKKLQIINITSNISWISHQEDKHSNTHTHHNHEHNPHIWTSIQESKKLLANICDILNTIDTNNSTFYHQNLLKSLKYLDTIDQQIRQTIKQTSYMVYHPSFSYFSRDYNLTEIIIEKEHKEPKPKELLNLIKNHKNIKTIIIDKNPIPKSVSLISQKTNAKVQYISSMSDWPINLLHLAQALGE